MIQIQVGDTAVPLELRLKDNEDPILGQAGTVAIRRMSDNFFLDFDDDTFKASGWTTKTQALVEVTGTPELAGVYRFVWDSSAAVLKQEVLAAEYLWTDPTPDVPKTDLLIFTRSYLAEKILRNRLKIDQATKELIIYDDDGTTEVYRAALTDKAGSPINLLELPLGLPVDRANPS